MTWRQYVFIALMIVFILIVGVGDPETRELIYPASVATLVVVMEIIGFALLAWGCFVHRLRCFLYNSSPIRLCAIKLRLRLPD